VTRYTRACLYICRRARETYRQPQRIRPSTTVGCNQGEQVAGKEAIGVIGSGRQVIRNNHEG
jgi:hypothetical protein